MFRFVIAVLAAVGLVSLISGGFGNPAAGIGALVLLPILILKIAIVLMIFGFIGRTMWDHDGGPGRWARRRRPVREAPVSGEDRFEEWHRMAHAREEVDRWVEGLPDDGRE